jgi:hypothetical protein
VKGDRVRFSFGQILRWQRSNGRPEGGSMPVQVLWEAADSISASINAHQCPPFGLNRRGGRRPPWQFRVRSAVASQRDVARGAGGSGGVSCQMP